MAFGTGTALYRTLLIGSLSRLGHTDALPRANAALLSATMPQVREYFQARWIYNIMVFNDLRIL
jgi:hypothetical protein